MKNNKAQINLANWSLIFILMSILKFFNIDSQIVMAGSWIVRFTLLFQMMSMMIRPGIASKEKQKVIAVGSTILILSIVLTIVYDVFFGQYNMTFLTAATNPMYVIALSEFGVIIWWYLKNKNK